MTRYSVEFESNDYENYIATWKNAHYILLHGNQDVRLYVYYDYNYFNYNYYYF